MKKIAIPALLATLSAPAAMAAGCHGSDSHNHHHHHGGHGHHHHVNSPVGEPAKADQATRTVQVDAFDTMRFEFSEELAFVEGEVVTFEITNHGQIVHEMSVGTPKEHADHRQMMLEMGDMDHDHDDGQTVTVHPGKTASLTWKFRAGEELLFSCNIPGHYEAGMYRPGKVTQLRHKHH